MRFQRTIKGAYKVATLILYIPWFVDIAIAVVSISSVVAILWFSIANRQLADWLNLAISLLAFAYSIANSVSKLNDDRKQRDVFKIRSAKLLEDCRNMILAYHRGWEDTVHQAEEQVLKTYFDDWKKHKDIQPFEFQMVESYLNFLAGRNLIDEGEKLFLEYRIVTSDLSSHFPILVGQLQHADFFTSGTPHNKFITKLYWLAAGKTGTDCPDAALSPEQIQETISYALKTSNPVMERLLGEQKNRERMEYLLHKCYENAYSNIGTLGRDLGDESKRNLVLLFKYDERFSILKRRWHTAIRAHLAAQFAKQEQLEEEYKKAEAELDAMLSPYPFSKALQDFDFCIERVAPREVFLYAIYPERFPGGTKGWTVEKFMNDRVIPRAEQYLKKFNRKMVRKYPYLRKYQKQSVDANYYIFHFSRRDFEYYADQDSIPTAIKRFIVRSILESEQAAEHLASQLVYMKQVINNITISGLLFTEDFSTQKEIQQKEHEILKRAKQQKLIIGNISEIASIGNQLELFTRVLYEGLFGTALKRKAGKNYLFAKKTCEKIAENAKEILQMFDALKGSAPASPEA